MAFMGKVIHIKKARAAGTARARGMDSTTHKDNIHLEYSTETGENAMPKVRPLGESARNAARWKEADRRYVLQLDIFKAITGLTQDQIARAIGVSQPTITHWRRNPGLMTKEHERRLVLLFEQHGVPYNPMLSMEEVKMA